jgi:hypothetical protein
MSSLKIIFETAASRCEICHQSDYFDGSINICTRCAEVEHDKQEPNQHCEQNYRLIDFGTTCGAASGMILGLAVELWKSSSYIQLPTYSMVLGLAVIGAIWGTIIGEGIERLH